MQQLQDTLGDVPLGDTLVMLGDFNARVGMFDPADGLWHKTIGRYGLAERNCAGEELLQFCELSQLTVLNTCFQKKSIHLGTWVHPATKLCHMIDFVMMRTTQRKCCLNVQVMHGANCWTDHYMVRARLRVMFSLPANVKKHPLPFAVHRLARPELHECYVQSLTEKLIDWSPASEDTAEECWNHLHSCVTCSAEEAIGRGIRSSPEWFEENVDVLEPLIQEKNLARSRYLQVGTRSRKQAFRKLQRLVQKAVSNAKRSGF